MSACETRSAKVARATTGANISIGTIWADLSSHLRFTASGTTAVNCRGFLSLRSKMTPPIRSGDLSLDLGSGVNPSVKITASTSLSWAKSMGRGGPESTSLRHRRKDSSRALPNLNSEFGGNFQYCLSGMDLKNALPTFPQSCDAPNMSLPFSLPADPGSSRPDERTESISSIRSFLRSSLISSCTKTRFKLLREWSVSKTAGVSFGQTEHLTRSEHVRPHDEHLVPELPFQNRTCHHKSWKRQAQKLKEETHWLRQIFGYSCKQQKQDQRNDQPLQRTPACRILDPSSKSLWTCADQASLQLAYRLSSRRAPIPSGSLPGAESWAFSEPLRWCQLMAAAVSLWSQWFGWSCWWLRCHNLWPCSSERPQISEWVSNHHNRATLWSGSQRWMVPALILLAHLPE